MLDQKAENGQKGEHVTKGTVGVAPSPGEGGIFNLFWPAARNTWENLTPEDGGGHPPTPLGGEGSGTLKEASW